MHVAPREPHANDEVPDSQTPVSEQHPEEHDVALHAGAGVPHPRMLMSPTASATRAGLIIRRSYPGAPRSARVMIAPARQTPVVDLASCRRSEN